MSQREESTIKQECPAMSSNKQADHSVEVSEEVPVVKVSLASKASTISSVKVVDLVAQEVIRSETYSKNSRNSLVGKDNKEVPDALNSKQRVKTLSCRLRSISWRQSTGLQRL